MLLVGIQESPRETERHFERIDIPRPATTTPTLSSRRFPPQSPAHPGWKQDDGARQVSWLPGLCPLSAFPEHCSSGIRPDRSPVTVAGAAAVSNRVPFQIPCGNLARGRTIQDVSARSIRPRGAHCLALYGPTTSTPDTSEIFSTDNFEIPARDFEIALPIRTLVLVGATGIEPVTPTMSR